MIWKPKCCNTQENKNPDVVVKTIEICKTRAKGKAIGYNVAEVEIIHMAQAEIKTKSSNNIPSFYGTPQANAGNLFVTFKVNYFERYLECQQIKVNGRVYHIQGTPENINLDNKKIIFYTTEKGDASIDSNSFKLSNDLI